MPRYLFTNQLELIETVRRAVDHGVGEIRITDCSGSEYGCYLDMDLSVICTKQDEAYITAFAKAPADIVTPWKVRVHPFGAGYCIARTVNGKTEHLLSNVGVAPQIQSYPTAAAASVVVSAMSVTSLSA